MKNPATWYHETYGEGPIHFINALREALRLEPLIEDTQRRAQRRAYAKRREEAMSHVQDS